MKYDISRYEESYSSLFIRIESTVHPVYIEHFYTDDERKDEDSRTKTLERLAAELDVISDAYVKPEEIFTKVNEAKALKVTRENIDNEKVKILAAKAKMAADMAVDIAPGAPSPSAGVALA